MGTLLYSVSALFDRLLSLVAGLPAIASLAAISVLTGVAMLWAFKRFSNQAAIREARKPMRASLYELRLFADEPWLIWRAQKQLLAANLRYLGLMLRPAVVLTVPMVVLLVQLEAFYGSSPLRVGEAAIVTLQMTEDLPAPLLEAPETIAIETPPVRIPAERRISWRIRPQQAVSGELRLVFPSLTLEKKIEAGEAPKYLSSRRASRLGDLFWNPGERPLPLGAVDWIEVRYPPAEVSLGGLEIHWLVWFLVISLASAWILKGRLGVAL